MLASKGGGKGGATRIKHDTHFDRSPPRWPPRLPGVPHEGPRGTPRGVQEAPRCPQDARKRPARGP
eukprot:3675109-Pyramimonas_sp.AAC.1